MEVLFETVTTDECEEVAAFLTGDTWPFHGRERPDADEIRRSFAKGHYTGEGNQTFWIVADGEKAGLMRVFELTDPTPLFDLRIRQAYRGRGIGEKALRWLTGWVFERYPHVIRIEAHTRLDNYAMRKVLSKCGYVREAYHRQAWRQGERLFDSVSYAIIRSDWQNGTTTPIEWNDVEF